MTDYEKYLRDTRASMLEHTQDLGHCEGFRVQCARGVLDIDKELSRTSSTGSAAPLRTTHRARPEKE